MRIGVLALQGAFSKHIQMLESLGVDAVEVRRPSELEGCDALVIPGGESTVMMKQLNFISMVEPLVAFAAKKPVFGTCAGLILMSQAVVGDSRVSPLQIMDITVERNAFGRQIESFEIDLDFHPEGGKRSVIPALFIRAPRIQCVGEGVKVLAKYNDEPVLVQQGQHLACTFHPELTGNPAIHHYFIKRLS